MRKDRIGRATNGSWLLCPARPAPRLGRRGRRRPAPDIYASRWSQTLMLAARRGILDYSQQSAHLVSAIGLALQCPVGSPLCGLTRKAAQVVLLTGLSCHT